MVGTSSTTRPRSGASHQSGGRHSVLSLDVEDVPLGSRPGRLAGVRPQERVQRHTVEQLADCVPVVPLLDVPVPQMVDQLMEILENEDY